MKWAQKHGAQGALRGFAAAAALLLAGCLTEPELKSAAGYEPARLEDGWEIARPDEVGLESAAVEALYRRFYSRSEFHNATALLVVRDGKLVAEGYTRAPADPLAIRHVQSITKSVTSLVFGTLHDDGTFPDLDERLSDILPASAFTGDPRAREITLRQLLTMSSGVELDNHNFATRLLMGRPRGQERVILARPFYADPGREFFYRDADPQLLSYAVEARTGRTLETIAAERLFAPLGIRAHYWEHNIDGVTLGAHALWLRARDLARIGQLALDEGVWRGERIVSADWIRRSTTTQIAPGSRDPAAAGFGYGFYWWTLPELAAFAAWGHGGQYILVMPKERLVAVLTASPDAGEKVGVDLRAFAGAVNTLLD
jgi:CubicO group peptidase (beta-lactamase class C family)